MFNYRRSFWSTIVTILTLVIFLNPHLAEADRVSDLQNQISNQTSEIQKLEAEIMKYQAQVISTNKQATTLQGTVKQLEATTKKLDADSALTTKKISSTELQIEKLELEIQASAKGIGSNREVIAETLRRLKQEEGDTTPLTALLQWKTTGDFWNSLASLSSLSTKLKDKVEDLRDIKTEQEERKKQAEKAKADLIILKSKLVDQKKIADANRKSTASLLAETKNQEANYRALVAQKLQRKQQVEAEIRQAEEAIKITINPSSVPKTGSGILRWPFDKVVITQYFGNTPFATANAQVYKGNGHNAIDLGAPVGTPIKAPLSGVVTGAGDTDLVCKGASYGRWIMIKHNNGLATIYAHLSLIKVVEGQSVNTGDIIGYSGATGYVTGPHLHFSVLASAGVSVGFVKSKVPGCGTYRIPLSPPSAYLNPLSYL
ncbi:MAG: peptidoglycan DD-metalloendopeptidase family protein [Candidatus Vogelbacteria bacterium]|nr:peptidoglycan DD-metalloendopeptidase family protein [Candidatus Vogelbacteria bacterium]